MATFSIKNHILLKNGNAVPQRATPNVGGALVKPTLLVMHYTAGQSGSGAISWLCDKRAKASAHLVVDMDGTVTQLAPFNRQTWHAGKSAWRGRSGCNAFSIGIEMVNPGWLKKRESGQYVDTNGKAVSPNLVEFLKGQYWMAYPSAQIEAAVAVAQAIVEAYGIKEIAGHSDIAPKRKIDPGPAFPMASFVSRVFGRAGDEPDGLDLYEVVRGDTLTKIAKAHGVPIDAIRKANPGLDPNKIEVGQKLVLP